MRKGAFISLCCILFLFLTGCAHLERGEEYGFSSLADSGTLVITADLERLKDSTLDIIPATGDIGSILERAERISISLTPERVDEYPLPMDKYLVQGYLEGDFPRVITNTALRYSGFKSAGEGNNYYYENGSLEVGVPKNGTLLFAKDNWYGLYDRVIKDPIPLIPDEYKTAMESSLISIFIESPKTLMDLGFDLPLSVLEKVDRAVLLIDQDDSNLFLRGELIMADERSAKTMNTVLRNQLIQKIKRSGERLDIKALESVFTYDGDVVKIDRMAIDKESESRIESMIQDCIGELI